MPDLLLELFSEEIPARMQRRAAEDLKKLVTDALVGAGLVYEGAKAFATPRRLALTVHGLPARSPDRREERKGPRVGAPQAAIDGFLKSAGLTSIGQARVLADKKGEIYVAVMEKPGRAAPDVIAEILPAIVKSFPWPKSMRWGVASAPRGTRFYGAEAEGSEALAWVRPLKSILCTFGPETEEPEVIAFSVDGVAAGNLTEGHRFMAPGTFAVRRFDDYMPKLEKAKVILDADRRKDLILHSARDRALALGLELVEDEALLEEVAGLVEWPVVLVGAFDEAFLGIPPEVIRTTIRANQKCFVMRRSGGASFETRPAGAPQDEEVGGRSSAIGAEANPPAGDNPHPEVRAKRASKDDSPHPEVRAQRASKDEGGSLSNRFLLVANIEASDGGKAIVAGNERVIRARLSDARHFWQTDLRPLPDLARPEIVAAAERLKLDLARPLDQRMAKLAATNVVFHEKLGTQGERVERIARLAREIAPSVGADPDKAERAAHLAKADLVTEMVGEFPELQGLIGRYYATAQGEDASVAAAVEDHYKPLGPSDRVPTDPVAIAVALADKLDLLVGFWAIDEKPTGSKDPYALRRAALGVIRIVLGSSIQLPLTGILDAMFVAWGVSMIQQGLGHLGGVTLDQHDALVNELQKSIQEARASIRKAVRSTESPSTLVDNTPKTADLLAFFADRLKVQLREQGARHDLVDAVFALGSQDDLLLIVRRVEALGKFLDSEDGRNLLAGYRRATNILRDEEKKSGSRYDGEVDAARLVEPEEKTLFEAIGTATGEARAAVEVEDFGRAMASLARLRGPVDAFFDKVLVNAPDPEVRANRLRLLNRLREATLTVADFSRISG